MFLETVWADAQAGDYTMAVPVAAGALLALISLLGGLSRGPGAGALFGILLGAAMVCTPLIMERLEGGPTPAVEIIDDNA